MSRRTRAITITKIPLQITVGDMFIGTIMAGSHMTKGTSGTIANRNLTGPITISMVLVRTMSMTGTRQMLL